MRKMRATEIAAVAGGTSPVIQPKGGSPGNGPTFVTQGPGSSNIDWWDIGNTGMRWGVQVGANGGVLSGGNLYFGNGNGFQAEGNFNTSGQLTGGSLTFTGNNGDSLSVSTSGSGSSQQFGLTVNVPFGGPNGSGGAYNFSLGSSPGAGSGSGSGGGTGSGYTGNSNQGYGGSYGGRYGYISGHHQS